MADNKANQGKRDDVTIDANDAGEVAYAAKEAGMTSTDFKKLMKAEGTNNRAKLMAAAKKAKK